MSTNEGGVVGIQRQVALLKNQAVREEQKMKIEVQKNMKRNNMEQQKVPTTQPNLNASTSSHHKSSPHSQPQSVALTQEEINEENIMME